MCTIFKINLKNKWIHFHINRPRCCNFLEDNAIFFICQKYNENEIGHNEYC